MGEPWELRAAVSADASQEPVELPRGVLLEVFQHARECYPEECCGLLVGEDWAHPHVVRCANVQNARVARGESELDAARAFWIDEQELLHALRSADVSGERLLAVYHSHVDTEAYLSHTDLSAALGPDGQPLYPGSAQLVVSVRDSGPGGAALFSWDERAGIFRGRRVR
jgi:proteasome lid subunit RPN8/RPN11